MAALVRKNLTAQIITALTPQPLDFGFVGGDSIFLGVALGTTHKFVGSGGQAPYAFSLLAGAIPGTTLQPDGTLTGTPTTQGTVNLTVQIQDSLGQTFPKTFAITVQGLLFFLAGGRDPQPSPQRNVAYQFQFRVADVNGSTAGITYAITTGAINAGLALSAGGLITGTPTAVGTQRFVVTATKAGFGTLVWTTSITVVQRISTIGSGVNIPQQLRNAVVGIPVDCYITFTAVAGSPPYWYEITANTLPAGLVMDTLGHVTGTPTALTGIAYVQPTFTIHDSFGQSFNSTPAGGGAIHVRPAVSIGPSGTFLGTNKTGDDQTLVDLYAQWFGDASDGNVTINGTNTFAAFAPLSLGVNTLTRNMYADTLTVTGSGKLRTTGRFDLYCNTLDISNAAAGSIQVFLVGSGGGANGGAGGTAGGSAGTNVNPSGNTRGGGRANVPDGVGVQGGGVGGNGTSGAGGPGAQTSPNANPNRQYDTFWANNDIVINATSAALDWVRGGNDGPGGGGGAGNGVAGGNGGDGGQGGGRLRIFARNIITSGSTPAGVIDARGNNGANGVAGSASGRGGGGGGCAGGGGFVRITYYIRTGPVVTNLILCDGGTGGNGGNGGGGAGVFGRGGYGGEGGLIIICCVDMTVDTVILGTTGATTAVQAGGAAGVCKATF